MAVPSVAQKNEKIDIETSKFQFVRIIFREHSKLKETTKNASPDLRFGAFLQRSNPLAIPYRLRSTFAREWTAKRENERIHYAFA